jgi:hypothetical protein
MVDYMNAGGRAMHGAIAENLSNHERINVKGEISLYLG